MGGIFTQVCLGAGLLILSLIGLVLAVSLGSLPVILEVIARIIRIIFLVSFRFYKILLTRMDPGLEHVLGLRPAKNPTRTILSIVFSTGFGLLICLVFRWPIKLWFLGVTMIHGCFIGLAWEDFFEPQGLYVGEEMK